MNIQQFCKLKSQNIPIVMSTCYDYPSAKLISKTSVDAVLVGDSVAMVVHGHPNTVMATMQMMELHTLAVARGLEDKLLISDMPFLSFRADLNSTMDSVKKLMQAGAHAIKIEGADDTICNTITNIVSSGVPVMGHIGLTPQHIHQFGGYKYQGRTPEAAKLLQKQAKKLAEAGCFALVLECVPDELAKTISQESSIPVIGIGAGKDTDGQILVWHDFLGFHTDCNPSFVRKYANIDVILQEAIGNYVDAVRNKK